MRRAAAVLLTTALTAGGIAALGAPASAAGATITPRHLWITVTNLGPEHRTCRIDADLYIPPGVDAQHRAPAILATNGFGGTKADQADLAQGMGELFTGMTTDPGSGPLLALLALSFWPAVPVKEA